MAETVFSTGVACRACGVTASHRRVTGHILHCLTCELKLSRTVDLIFHDTRTPRTVWFQEARRMATNKNVLNAKVLQRQLGIGSYQTAWAMLYRYRTPMTLAGADLLSGTAEVDETFYGGAHPRQSWVYLERRLTRQFLLLAVPIPVSWNAHLH